MAWHLPGGCGALTGADADLYVASLASIYDMMLQEGAEGIRNSRTCPA